MVAIGGAMTLFLASRATPGSIDRSIYYDTPKHPVTEAMRRRSAEEARKPSPVFATKDFSGKPVSIGKVDHPQFVYFVLDGCPCSVDAEPLFQSLWKHFQGNVEFVSVTNGDRAMAKKWSSQMLMPYPLVPDPKLEIVHAFGATNSVASVLIDGNGRIVKMWPGYSQDLLAEMNRTMAEALGEPVRPFDASYAPKKQAAGCAFAPANP